MSLNEVDIAYLQRAAELAELARGLTTPNPLVGAVIVSKGKVIGEGYHAAVGREHAEVAAMTSAGPDASFAGATMYVTLEPCCNFGRTPPCAPAVVSAGFARVVVGSIDPSPDVNGRGLQMLRDGGVQVDLAEGDMELRCKRQNNGFRKAVATGLPFVTYKYAMTIDGRVAADGGDSKWVSCADSRVEVHDVRRCSDAVMVGANTLRGDNPTLTVRDVPCARQPLRVVADSALTVRKDSNLVHTIDQGAVLIICADTVSADRRAEVESWGVETAAVSPVDGNGRPSPEGVARLLAGRGIQYLLLEGGPALAGAWWDAGLIDEVMAFVAPRVVSGRECWSPLRGRGAPLMGEATALREVRTRAYGDDVCISGYVREAY